MVSITLSLFIFSLLMMFFFAGIEMAYYTADRISIEIKKKSSDNAYWRIAKFIDNPVRFIGTTLFGFTFFLCYFTLQMNYVMLPLFKYLKITSSFAEIVAEILLTSFLVIIFGGFLPRFIFRARSNSLLSKLSVPTHFFYLLFSPLTDIFIRFCRWFLKYIVNIRVDEQKYSLSAGDIKHLFQQKRNQEKQFSTRQLLENAEEFPKVKVRQCMVPRTEIVAIPDSESIENIVTKFVETKLNKIIVYGKSIDDIKGYVHYLHLLQKPNQVSEIILPIITVPESMSAADLMYLLNKDRKSIAWVIDEFGGTAGIITLNDLLEKLFGEIKDPYSLSKTIEKVVSDTEYVFSGRLEIDYLEHKYGLPFPNNHSETLSGYIIHFFETIPSIGERIIINDYEFHVQEVSAKRIELVAMKKLIN